MLSAAARIDLTMYLTLYRRSYKCRVALLSDDLLAARQTALRQSRHHAVTRSARRGVISTRHWPTDARRSRQCIPLGGKGSISRARRGRPSRRPTPTLSTLKLLLTKSANCTNVRVWFYRHRRRRSLSMRAGCLRPVPASGGRACLDILSHGRAPCASSRYGAKDLRKLPYFQEHKRQLEGSEASGLVASDPSS